MKEGVDCGKPADDYHHHFSCCQWQLYAAVDRRRELGADAVWQVTGTSLITSLNLSDSARVIIPEGVTLTVGGTEYTDCTLTADSVR